MIRTALLLPFLLLSPAPLAAEAAEGDPVLLELFTAQGCSSCPAADELLSALGQAEETRRRVVPLAFHVDYWNREGWPDPFADAAWSRRQEAYAAVFGLQGVYTPQLVIDGEAHQNGGEARRALAALEARRGRTSAGEVRVLLLAQEGDAPGALAVEVEGAWRGEAPGRADLWVALLESGLRTRVRSGENRGKTLREDNVVRRLVRAASLPARAEARVRERVRIGLGPAWRSERLGVAAFLQDPVSLRVYGATVRRLEEAP